MLIDTHCHINIMVKQTFDTELDSKQIAMATDIIKDASKHAVSKIINVGTSLIESTNCVALARRYDSCYAAVGIHPTDLTSSWHQDFKQILSMARNSQENKIVAIGETGIDLYHPNPNLARQQDAFKAHIELALKHDLAIIVHSRDAADQTIRVLELYKNDLRRGIMHCFSYDRDIANIALSFNLVLGIGGTITYPKNNALRSVIESTPLSSIVLETDAPFLPPQHMRGQQNHPSQIKTIAQYLAQLRNESYEQVASQTTQAALQILQIPYL